MTTTLLTTDPRTGERRDTHIAATDDDAVTALVRAAHDAAGGLEARDRLWRADLLEAIAAQLEQARDSIVATAESETGLTQSRLNGELTRSTYQFHLFAEAVREGGYLEAAIDHAADTHLGAQPDVRRMLVSIGPVAVFGSSNFPFAFSVPGGDTASALAAGNPVVIKAHSSHPLTSLACAQAMSEGAREVGAPDGTIGIVFGQPAGVALVSHPSIAAVAFTGSLAAAEQLRSAIDGRDCPIPFYGELQSANPMIVTAAALAARSAEIATDLVASVVGSGGQLCTKPGLVFVPAGRSADQFAELAAAAVRKTESSVLLNERVLSGFQDAARQLTAAPGVRVIATGVQTESTGGFDVTPRVLRVRAKEVDVQHTQEAFGPLVMIVDYDGDDDLFRALTLVPDSLTAAIHLESTDMAWARQHLPSIAASCGRIVFNGYPTGVRVSWAQHHGGPWPATDSLHTSVGVTAMRRFLRPLAWQNAPESLLPDELRDGPCSIPRRVDGTLTLASMSTAREY